MWPDRVSNPGPLTYESGALPTALRGPATKNSPNVHGNPIASEQPKLHTVLAVLSAIRLMC